MNNKIHKFLLAFIISIYCLFLKNYAYAAVTLPTPTEYKMTVNNVNLNAYIYMNDENSGKWALLLHPSFYDGARFATSSVGKIYYEKGYNIIAPDIRGNGKSEGGSSSSGGYPTVTYIDGLDVYYWLEKLNNDYKVDCVIAHGVSLGASALNFFAGIDKFMANMPMGGIKGLRPISELKVYGLVDDCGFVNTYGSTTYSYMDATNSLQHCTTPIFIIHGKNDPTISFANAEAAYEAVPGVKETWYIEGGGHAVIMGSQENSPFYNTYKQKISDFINKYEPSISTGEDTLSLEDNIKSVYDTKIVKSENYIYKIANNTTINEFINNIKLTNKQFTVKNYDDQVLSNYNTLIASGMILESGSSKYKIAVLGDLDRDGKPTSFDAFLTLKMSVGFLLKDIEGLNLDDDIAKLSADWDKNNLVDAFDAYSILDASTKTN